MKKSLKNSGQILLESMIALTVIIMILAGVAVVMVTTVSNATFVKNQNVANKLAQEGIEYIRNLRENNADFPYTPFPSSYKFSTFPFTPRCLNTDGRTFSLPPCTPIDSGYIREVTFSDSAATCQCPIPAPTGSQPCDVARRVEVEVRWSSGKCTDADRFCHRAKVETCMLTTGTTL